LKLLAILSGENPTIPHAEIRGILEAEGIDYQVAKTCFKCLIFEAGENSVEAISRRAAYTQKICQHIQTLENFKDLEDLRKIDPFEIKAGTFRVRAYKTGSFKAKIERLKVERELGKIVKSWNPHLKGDMEKPQVEITVLLTDNYCIVGKTLKDVDRSVLVAREASLQAFFHPGAMKPTVCRAMVNLARARPGEILLDPFCGSGGILVEASLIGCHAIGVDISMRRIREAEQVMLYYGIENVELHHGNALYLEYDGNVDAIATDPPYGRGTVPHGQSREELLKIFAGKAAAYLKPGGYICIATPKESKIEEYLEDSGFKVLEKHYQYVHGGLTRKFTVARR